MKLRIAIAELTYADGRVTGSIEETITEGGRTTTVVRDLGSPPPKPSTRRSRLARAKAQDGG